MAAKQSKKLLNKFLKDLLDNTPHAKQFEEKDLGKIKRSNRNRRQMQVLSARNNKHR